ncbi:MAG: DUF2807 domain-containing protein [Chloroflexota bacterium]|nr:MAG: DUF2807 domain-containing protein [Chloroflexota bacterium]
MKVDGDTIIQSGVSNNEIAGSANDITIQASDGSKGMLKDFPVANAKVNLSGRSEATINTNGRLDCNLSGSSRLNTIGAPKLGEIKISGNSTINRE